MAVSVTINGIDYTANAALPIKWSGLLDERLDEGRLSLKHVDVDIFPIGSTVSIDSELDFVVASDEASESPCGGGLFNHELSLIEPTKLLEGIIVETLTFQNSLGRTYTSNQVKVEPVYE